MSQIERIQARYRQIGKDGFKPLRVRLSPRVHSELLEEFRTTRESYPRTLPRGANCVAITSLFGLPVLIDASETDFKIEVI